MKNVYIFMLFSIALMASRNSLAQCTCSDGSTPDSISYEQYFDSIVSTNTTISFPQFDAAIGILTCFKLADTVTTIASYNLQNNLPDTEAYAFTTSRLSEFSGPGGFDRSISSNNKHFGPYTLAPKDSAGDNIDIGPDTTFFHQYDQSYGTPSAAFYGTGTVDFNYLNTSTFAITTGSTNAIFTLRGYTRLDVTLTYYWCPYTALETRLTNFTTSYLGQNILIQWKVNDLQPTDSYEIEMSTNGKEFQSIGQGTFTLTGNIASFKLLYNPPSDYSGYLFFRIKQTNYAGNISYSNVQNILIKNNNQAAYRLYPNPAVTGIQLQFANNSGGSYSVALFNTEGQVIFRKNYTMSGSGAINIQWNNKPAAGIYFLKVIDLENNIEQVEKMNIL